MLFFLVMACSRQQRDMPVSDRTWPETVLREVHVVQPGETLFSIAWRYKCDYRRLANANNIPYPHVIYPGQRLSLSRPDLTIFSQTGAVAKAPVAVPDRAVKTEAYKKEPAPTVEKNTDGHSVPGWQWPANGTVISHFSFHGRTNKGIDLAGKIGEPVFAAAAGEVVYAGSGLTGYGNLIIIKHNGSYISAYAHSKVLLVKEGSVVKAGQKIAEIGSTGTNEPKLHFEIRRNGKPVDPLLYLSKR